MLGEEKESKAELEDQHQWGMDANRATTKSRRRIYLALRLCDVLPVNR